MTLVEIRGFQGPHRWLSNFWPCPGGIYLPTDCTQIDSADRVLDDGLDFGCVENAYQAAKCDPEDYERFVGISPGQAKGLGKRIGLKGPMSKAAWSGLKYTIMEGLITQKFRNYSTTEWNYPSELTRKLLETGDATLIEANIWHDNDWGVCICDRCKHSGIVGQNMLGKTIMRVRERLRNG